MCISSKASIFTFFFSIISSIILILFGNIKFKLENTIIGLVMIYVAFMQIFEYFIWIDLDNKKGYNKKASQLGALFNYTQPTILYIFSNIFMKKNNIYINLLNLLYFIYFITKYYDFLNSKEVVTHVNNKHLNWNWIKYFNFYFYALTLIINLCYFFTNIKYLIILFIIIIGTFMFSYIKFNQNTSELWCYIVAYFPLILCGITYLI